MLVYATSLGIVSLMSAAAFANNQHRIDARHRSVRTIALFGGLLYLEFFVFGKNSFIFMVGEGNVVNPIFNYISNAADGQVFAHEIAGGSDLYSAIGSGMQYFSFEMILLTLFPHWLAVALQKLWVFSAGAIGAYLLCRKGVGASRPVAVAMTLLFSVIDTYHVFYTLILGMGHLLMPLAIYLAVFRANEDRYYFGISLLMLFAATVLPTHFLPFPFAIIGGAILFGARRLDRVAVALVLICIALLANWHEVIYAMKQIAPLTERGSQNVAILGLSETLQRLVKDFPFGSITFVLYAFSLALLAICRDPFFWRAAAALISLPFLYLLAHIFPWESIGLGVVRGLSWAHAFLSLNALLLPVAAKAAMAMPKRFPKPGKLMATLNPAAIAFGIAVGLLLWNKSVTAIYWLKDGGQSQFHSIGNLLDPKWAPGDHFRVVTLRAQKPDPDIVSGFYGLDAYDGFLELPIRRHARYWRLGIRREPLESTREMPSLFQDFAYWPRSERVYDLAAQISLPLLGVANVSHVISPYPLREHGLKKVSGPDGDRPFYRLLGSGVGKFQYLRHRMGTVFDFGDVYIYRLARHLPLAYPIESIEILPHNTGDKAFLSRIEAVALDGVAVIRGTETTNLTAPQQSLRILETEKVLNGYRVSVDAPDGGLLALNASHVPFWKASADGAPLEITAVNWVHMAVAVPPGAHEIRFSYRRPMIRDHVRCYLGDTDACPGPDKV